MRIPRFRNMKTTILVTATHKMAVICIFQCSFSSSFHMHLYEIQHIRINVHNLYGEDQRHSWSLTNKSNFTIRSSDKHLHHTQTIKVYIINARDIRITKRGSTVMISRNLDRPECFRKCSFPVDFFVNTTQNVWSFTTQRKNSSGKGAFWCHTHLQ